MRVAIVYDRVNKWGGAERVLLALHEIYPKAPLYTSVYDAETAGWARVFPEVKTSFLQKIPFAKRNHELLAILMPLAFKSLNMKGWDLVISVTSEFSKNLQVESKTVHICYCLTPTRYLWSGYTEYFKSWALKKISIPVVSWLRRVDMLAAKKPHVIIAISSEVKKRVKKYYGRDSYLLFPPATESLTQKRSGKKRINYLVVSRLDYGYKKVDLVINVFNKLGYPLIIVGTGRAENKLRRFAGDNIIFTGRVSEKKLANYYGTAKALIMPQEEDFGIVSVEAQRYGTPVIAFKKGGAKDTVIHGKTGLLFEEQTEESLTNTILRFEKLKFIEDNLIRNAAKFSKKKFKMNFAKIVQNELRRKQL